MKMYVFGFSFLFFICWKFPKTCQHSPQPSKALLRSRRMAVFLPNKCPLLNTSFENNSKDRSLDYSKPRKSHRKLQLSFSFSQLQQTGSSNKSRPNTRLIYYKINLKRALSYRGGFYLSWIFSWLISHPRWKRRRSELLAKWYLRYHFSNFQIDLHVMESNKCRKK